MTRMPKNLKVKMIVSYFLLLVMIVGIWSYIGYKISENIIEKQVGDSNTEVLHQISINLNNMIKEIESIANIFYFDENLRRFIRNNEASDRYEKSIEIAKLMNSIYTYTYSFSNFDYYSIVYAFNGNSFSSFEFEPIDFQNIPKMPWFQDVVEKDGYTHWLRTQKDIYKMSSDDYVISAIRLIKGLYTNNHLGVLMLNFNERVLRDTLSQAQTSGKIFITDAEGFTMSSESSDQIGLNIAGDRKYAHIFRSNDQAGYYKAADSLITFQRIPHVNWIIIEDVSLSDVLKPIHDFRNIMLFILFAVIVVGLLTTMIIASRIFVPMNENFDNMTHTIRRLMGELIHEENLKKQAQFDFLQAQIKPHFVYNTLNSIRCMVAMDEKENAEHMIITFNKLLRKMLSDKNEYISVQQELSQLEDYLLLLKCGNANRFMDEFIIDESILNIKIPKLLLQPLLENAVFHGLEPKQGVGKLSVWGYSHNESAVFVISDNGVGMNPHKLDLMKRVEQMEGAETQLNIGLLNIRKRLKLYYGNRYKFHIWSEEGKGTVIKIMIPCE